MLLAAQRAGFRKAIVPLENRFEAELVENIEIIAAANLGEVARLHGADVQVAEREEKPLEPLSQTPGAQLCMSEVFGQSELVDALVLAAAGRHHILMVGPPGAGKTMLAERLPTILPELTLEEALEAAAVRSIAKPDGLTNLDRHATIQAPHHSSSMVAMIGGGSGSPKPGLISLAHNGVLFLDEAPEFSSQTLESLRQLGIPRAFSWRWLQTLAPAAITRRRATNARAAQVKEPDTSANYLARCWIESMSG